jgi:phospholipase D1/2
MADETYAAYLTPNVARFGDLITIKLSQAPLKASPVQLKLYELNDYTWVDANDPQKTISCDEEDPRTGEGHGDDLLATWNGKIRWQNGGGSLKPIFAVNGNPTIVYQGDGQKTLFYNTIIPVQIEGQPGTFEIPLALDRKRHYEGDTLELGVRIERGPETLFRGYHATLVRDWRWWAKNSFAPPRRGNRIKYYSNGSTYWADLSHALLAAKRTIYITGWKLSAQVKLKRPGDNLQTLASYLSDAGRRSVKVRLLLTDTSATFKSALNNWDEVAQAWLMSHPGIEVSRHRPDPHLLEANETRTGLDRPFWTHHQKTVMIDDQIAFVGGIDLAEGRWDTDDHGLDDANASEDTEYGNFKADEQLRSRELARGSRPRMPWHDIHSRIEGPAARDVSVNFVQRWNKASDFQRKSLEKRAKHTWFFEQRRGAAWADDVMSANRELEKLVPSWEKLDRPMRLKRLQSQLADLGEFNRARDVIRNARIDYEVKVMLLVALYTYRFDEFSWRYVFGPMRVLFQESYAIEPEHEWSSYLDLMSTPSLRDRRFTVPGEPLPDSAAEAFTPIAIPPEPAPAAGGAIVQVVRSVGETSLPSDAVAAMKARTGKNRESSILDTYGIAINLAQHYIYIETQMFISHANKLGEALRDKIAQKMVNRERFFVYLIVPEVYDGDPFNTSAREVNHFQWQSIRTLREQLGKVASQNGVDADDYFQPFCLRKLGKVSIRNNNQARQIARVNLIYVHSKLMIVDDTFVTVGSANLNQRSLLGDRDSEINVNILDDEEVIIKVGDPKATDPWAKLRDFRARKSAYEFRMHLWRKHLGVDSAVEPGTDMTIQNPTHPATVKLWRDRALLNRSLTSGIFNGYHGTKVWDPPGDATIRKAVQQGLRGYITTFGLEKETEGESSPRLPDFLTE